MPSPSEIIDMAASLMNDTAQSVYTDAACLPYLNMALRDLQEEFELNEIPVTQETTAILNVDSGVTEIKFSGSTPILPADLIEINRLWESDEGQDTWTPVTKRDYIPHYIEGVQISKFLIWAWIDNAIKLPSSNQDNDLKIDYIKSLFPTIKIGVIDAELGAKFTNIFSYLGYRTAALCSFFIGENETRAAALQNEAEKAILKSMGISIKGRQGMIFRRKPFRLGYKLANRGTF